jgi:hypothetical protein
MTYRYKFIVNHYDVLEKKNVIEAGYIIAEDNMQAIERLQRYYGKDNINSFYLEADYDTDVIVIEQLDTFDANWKGPALYDFGS